MTFPLIIPPLITGMKIFASLFRNSDRNLWISNLINPTKIIYSDLPVIIITPNLNINLSQYSF